MVFQPRVLRSGCFPVLPLRFIVLVVIVLAVAVLVLSGCAVTASLSAIAAASLLAEEVSDRLSHSSHVEG
jgi:outer membrane lipoprotein-sorting protein